MPCSEFASNDGLQCTACLIKHQQAWLSFSWSCCERRWRYEGASNDCHCLENFRAVGPPHCTASSSLAAHLPRSCVAIH